MEQQVAAKHQCCTFTVRNERQNLFFANLRYIFFSSVGVGAHSKCALKKPTGRRRLICTLLYPLSIFSLCFSKASALSLHWGFTQMWLWHFHRPLDSRSPPLLSHPPLPPLLPQSHPTPPPLFSLSPFARLPSSSAPNLLALDMCVNLDGVALDAAAMQRRVAHGGKARWRAEGTDAPGER